MSSNITELIGEFQEKVYNQYLEQQSTMSFIEEENEELYFYGSFKSRAQTIISERCKFEVKDIVGEVIILNIFQSSNHLY